MGQLSRDATRQSRQLCVTADERVAAPATPQQLTYAAGGTSIQCQEEKFKKKFLGTQCSQWRQLIHLFFTYLFTFFIQNIICSQCSQIK